MAYRIQWEPKGAIKIFVGQVTFQDIYESECDIQSSPEFDDLRYIMSIFEGDTVSALSKSQCDLILALRLGAMNSNSRLKYAYVSLIENMRGQVGQTLKTSNSAFPVKMFENLDDATDWIKL
jgi:hypothetical protein